MPLIDLPLEELARYQGRNPCPDDFDAFWEKALAELDETFDDVHMRPADFESRVARAYHLTFSSVRGAHIYAKLLVPKAAAAAPAVIGFHGYTGNSGDWSEKLPLVSEGIAVAAIDVRGQGGSSTDPGGYSGTTFYGHIIRGASDSPDELLYRHIYLDCVRLVRIVAALPEIDASRVCTMGASQGGGLALACAALEPSVARVAALYPFLCDWQRVWELDFASDAYEGLSSHFRVFDPLHQREQEFFQTMGYVDVQHLAPRIEADVLIGTGLMDEVCPPSTQFAVYNKLVGSKRMVVFPDFGHETVPRWNDIVFDFLGGV